MSEPLRLEGPHFSTVNWDKDFNGVHPVEMLARIAKFEGKAEAKYDTCRRQVTNKEPCYEYKKVVICLYDDFTSFGNGKLEKQAKLVSARNMISKIRTKNIGIVNETLAAGVTIEKHIDTDPHKKPISRQFKSFTAGGSLSTMSNFRSAGTLGSFAPASDSSGKSCDIVKPPVSGSAISQTDREEIEQYKAYVEGKVESPTEKLEAKTDSEEIVCAASEPKIVFKRSGDSVGNVREEPESKKQKASHIEEGWDPSSYGYHQGYSRERSEVGGYHGRYTYGGRGSGYS